MKKKNVCVLISLIMLSIIVVDPVWATTIPDIRKQQQDTQSQLDNVNSNISDVEDIKDVLDEEIGELDATVIEILASISLLEEDIATLEAEIVQAQIEYELAQEEENNQYEAMKVRIQFMYEEGEISYLQILMEAKGFTDILNKADYIEQLYAYDRQLLVEYQDAVQAVAEYKEILEIEEAELVAVKHEYEEEKQAMELVLEEKKAASANYETQLAQLKQQAAAYKTKIKQQTTQIKQMEAAEAARRAAEEKAKNNNSSNNNVGRLDPSIITNATGSALGKEIATYACQFIGNPYVAGGTSLTQGADCSGFTYAVYKAYGYNLPRTSSDQRNCGKEVDYANAEPGDLICYAGHVGIYIGGGKIVHASSERTGIKISNATYRAILCVRRII